MDRCWHGRQGTGWGMAVWAYVCTYTLMDDRKMEDEQGDGAYMTGWKGALTDGGTSQNTVGPKIQELWS